MRWIIINLLNDQVFVFKTFEEATKRALEENAKSEHHPSFLLFKSMKDDFDGEAMMVGRLWRAFGQNFNPNDCWRLQR